MKAESVAVVWVCTLLHHNSSPPLTHEFTLSFVRTLPFCAGNWLSRTFALFSEDRRFQNESRPEIADVLNCQFPLLDLKALNVQQLRLAVITSEISKIANLFPNLEELQFQGWFGESLALPIDFLFDFFPMLKKITLGDCLTESATLESLSRLRHLTSFSMHNTDSCSVSVLISRDYSKHCQQIWVNYRYRTCLI